LDKALCGGGGEKTAEKNAISLFVLISKELIWKNIFVPAQPFNAPVILATMIRDAIYVFKRIWNLGKFRPVSGLMYPMT
jgi:hypothetical protein